MMDIRLSNNGFDRFGSGWQMLYNKGIPEELAKIGVWIRLRTDNPQRLGSYTALEAEYYPKEILEDLDRRYKKGLQIIDQSGISKELEKIGLYVEVHAWV